MYFDVALAGFGLSVSGIDLLHRASAPTAFFFEIEKRSSKETHRVFMSTAVSAIYYAY